jgi:hypothetical protein
MWLLGQSHYNSEVSCEYDESGRVFTKKISRKVERVERKAWIERDTEKSGSGTIGRGLEM